MTHLLDRLAVRAATGPPKPNVAASAGTAGDPPRELPGIPDSPIDGLFSRRAGLRTFGLAAGLLVAGPWRALGASSATAAPSDACLPGCLAAADNQYREDSIHCNSGIPEPRDVLAAGVLFSNPFCQAIQYQRLVDARRRCRGENCGKKPPPPAPPTPKRGPPPPPPGGCGLIGMTGCGATCCPAGYLCSGSTCIPPPSKPPPVDQCNPPCPPGKKCQNGQCVDVSSDCGTCPPGAKCCSGCSFGAYCAAADFTCHC